jgi:hypothetical protein
MALVAVPPAVAPPVAHIFAETGQKDARAMNDKPKNDSNLKVPYQPPQVVRVSLRPEEAVLGHCKVAGLAGPISGSCRTLFCKTFGS